MTITMRDCLLSLPLDIGFFISVLPGGIVIGLVETVDGEVAYIKEKSALIPTVRLLLFLDLLKDYGRFLLRKIYGPFNAVTTITQRITINGQGIFVEENDNRFCLVLTKLRYQTLLNSLRKIVLHSVCPSKIEYTAMDDLTQTIFQKSDSFVVDNETIQTVTNHFPNCVSFLLEKFLAMHVALIKTFYVLFRIQLKK